MRTAGLVRLLGSRRRPPIIARPVFHYARRMVVPILASFAVGAARIGAASSGHGVEVHTGESCAKRAPII